MFSSISTPFINSFISNSNSNSSSRLDSTQINRHINTQINNFVNNLRLLCPNCHTQTDNFGSKGTGSRYKKHTKRNSYLREYKGSVA